eukprot:403341439
MISKITKITLLLVGGILLNMQGTSARYSMGSCAEVDYMSSFNPALYVGRWYEIFRDAETSFEKGTDCVVATYGKITDNIVSVYNYAVYLNDNSLSTIRGQANCKGSKCKVKFDQFFIPTGNYNVLDTDYTNYAIVHSCTNFLFGLFKSEIVWVLGRAQTMSAGDITLRKQTINDNLPGYDADANLYQTVHGGSCVYE